MISKNDLKDSEYDVFVSSMFEIVKRYNKIQEQQRALGLFSYGRELLKCHACGLTEDINFIRKLFTYRCGDTEFKCPNCAAECLVPLEAC